MRVDQALVERGLCRSRSEAQRLISKGAVSMEFGGKLLKVRKPSQKLEVHAVLKIEKSALAPYVSRAGEKLAGALEYLRFDVSGLTVLDIGQSTGGFSDCVLQSGATKVVGIDVGRDQLDASLRKDPRVVCIENCNARELNSAALEEHCPDNGFPLVVMDISFISQTLVYSAVRRLISDSGRGIFLVKPQFELSKSALNKKGLVKNSADFCVVENRIRDAARAEKFSVKDFFESVLPGGDGNREYFVALEKYSGRG